MTWEVFYLVCFLVGFLMSIASFLPHVGKFDDWHGHFHTHLGHGGGGHGHVGGHAHGGHAHAGQHPGQGSGPALAKFNVTTMMAFLTWFGATGYLINKYTAVWALLAILTAVAVGLVGASLMFWFMSKLINRDHTLNPADFDMVGVLGRVSSTVRPGGTGEMLFTQEGARKASAVRSEDNTPIERGIEVVVTRYENGIAYVRRWEELAG